MKAMDTVREELRPDIDFAIECHWRYDVNDVIRLAKALEHVRPMWLEDPVPPDNPEAMARVAHAVDVPICTGENLYGRQGFRKLIELQACAGVHIDIPKSGGLLEAKRFPISPTCTISGPRRTIPPARWVRSHRPTRAPPCVLSASTNWRATLTGGRTW